MPLNRRMFLPVAAAGGLGVAAWSAASASPHRPLHAVRLSLVLFFIAFAFAFDRLLLKQGPLPDGLVAFAVLLVGTEAGPIALVGYLNSSLSLNVRVLYGAAAMASILFPIFSSGWTAALLGAGFLVLWSFIIKPRLIRTRAASLGRIL
jgi:TRAP-type uncharacterized transport system fused permease subunit